MDRIAQPTTHEMSSRSGQSIAELLIAITLGVILVGTAASLILPALRTNTQATNIQKGAALGNGLLNNVRVWSQGNWDSLLALATGSANTYFLQTAQSPFLAATGTESISNDNVTSSLMLWWKLDEGSGSTTIDSSGNAATGTWNGAPAGTAGTYYTAGRIGQYAGAFNGVNDYVSAGNLGSFPAQGTISFWMLSSALASYPNPLTTNYSGGNAGIRFEQNGNNFSLVVGNDTGTYNLVSYTSGMVANTWYHVVYTWNTATNMEAGYWNGAQVFSGANTYWPTTIPNFVVGEGFATSRYWNGSMDDVRMYARALSPAEVSAIYQSSYQRYFYVSDVYRSASGTIVSTPGVYDPSTKEITVGYSWPGVATQTISTYLTRNQNFVLDQTDWSGGMAPGGTVLTTTNSQFATSSNIDYATTTGSFYLAIPGY